MVHTIKFPLRKALNTNNPNIPNILDKISFLVKQHSRVLIHSSLFIKWYCLNVARDDQIHLRKEHDAAILQMFNNIDYAGEFAEHFRPFIIQFINQIKNHICTPVNVDNRDEYEREFQHYSSKVTMVDNDIFNKDQNAKIPYYYNCALYACETTELNRLCKLLIFYLLLIILF